MGRRADMSGGRGRLARHDLYVVLAVSACFVLVLIAKSAMDFSRSGPQIADEIARSYLGYAVYALARLGAWAFAITALMAAAAWRTWVRSPWPRTRRPTSGVMPKSWLSEPPCAPWPRHRTKSPGSWRTLP